MNAVADVPDVRYAVIEGLQTETGHERIVIAYPNEESLRDLIAALSIVALGFVSRDEAVVSGEASFPNAVVDQRAPKTMAGAETDKPRRLNQQRRGGTGSISQKVRRFVSSSCSEVLSWGDRHLFFQQFCLDNNPNGAGQFGLDSLSATVAAWQLDIPFSLKDQQDGSTTASGSGT